MRNNRNRWLGLITFLPMLFMLATTVDAGLENIFGNYLPQHSFNGYLNTFLSGVMLVLAVVIVIDSLVKWYFEIKKTGMISHLSDIKTKEKDPALELDI